MLECKATELSGVAIQVSSGKISHVPSGLHIASKLLASTAGFWKMMGNLESFMLGKDMQRQKITQPVFVSSLARSGSTILTEIISQHSHIACHHYSDFPLTWLPYWWNNLRKQLPLPKQEPRERAHGDRLLITSDSVEAIEEVLWMHFFPDAHNPQCSHVINADENPSQFEKHYKNHIRKLLLVRGRQRYLAKNNYHVTRLEYLLKIFPDARFVVPVRGPVQQVASLLKQHRLFSQKNVEDTRVARQLKMSGHYEFGPLRCPVVVDESRTTYRDSCLEDLAWYANQWTDVYSYLNRRMRENPALAKVCLVVRYEDICAHSTVSLGKLFAHLGLDDGESERITEGYAPILKAPEYYKSDFSTAQEDLIREITRDTARLYSYD